jgi:hypothetical protein
MAEYKLFRLGTAHFPTQRAKTVGKLETRNASASNEVTSEVREWRRLDRLAARNEAEHFLAQNGEHS